MTEETRNYEKDLAELYKHTYGEARQYMSSFEEVSVVKASDGQKYAVGVLRNTNEQDTSFGDYEPHMRSWGVFFAASIDDKGQLSGDSVRIKGESREACYHSERYKQKMRHLPSHELNGLRKASTFIEVDFNKADELPRTVLCSDGSLRGQAIGDYLTIVNGFYNVVDRKAFLEASRSTDHYKLYRNSEENEKIAELCAQFLIPGESDKKCQEAEQQRLARNVERKAEQERISKIKALRKFIERENEKKSKGLKIFGCGVLQKSARKALARRMLPKLIKRVQAGQKQSEHVQPLQMQRHHRGHELYG